MKQLLFIPLLALYLTGYCQTGKKKTMNDKRAPDACEDNCTKKELSCKLTTPELTKRKVTVIANLKKQVIERQELANGYSYKFKGSDNLLDELSEFIKTERLCCDFFDFAITIKGDASIAILAITGPNGTKSFITSELEL